MEYNSIAVGRAALQLAITESRQKEQELRKELQEKGIKSGINSALTGNFLTTTGTTIESDKAMVRRNGYEIK